ncbi:MAG: MoaD family protein [Dehalococcoidia bacterium]|nr:MoaD family protein [Dehalococcoidia bacterium]
MKPTSYVTAVRLYGSLRELAGELEIDVSLPDGARVRDLLGRLEELRPALAHRLLDENGNITRFANVFVNGRDIRDLDGLDTPVLPNDEVTILPPAAGGKA